MSAALAELWTARLVGLALLLQTIELLQIRHVLGDRGVWRWAILRQEHRALWFPIRVLFRLLLPYRAFVAVLLLRLPCAVALWAGNSFVVAILLVSQLAIALRFRGTFNGGSDNMTVLTLLALTVAWLFHEVPLVVTGSLVFVAVELVLSYCIAGIAKAKERAWWTGAALRAFVRDASYGAPRWAREVTSHPRASAIASWLVIAFECAFPVSLTSFRVSVAFAATGLAFHVANALVFGLNRFVFAWAAAYPALFFTATLVESAGRG